jgi:hypothetical protein
MDGTRRDDGRRVFQAKDQRVDWAQHVIIRAIRDRKWERLIFLFVIASKRLEVEYAWSSEEASNNKRASKPATNLNKQQTRTRENQNRTPLPKSKLGPIQS